MNHSIKHISIPQPCTQNWADMAIAEQGRYCQSCRKTVTDFTNLTNEQILASLSRSGNTCGRITNEQLKTLNATLFTPPQTRFSWRRLSWAAAVISFLSLLKAEAKAIVPKVTQHQSFSFKKTAITDDPVVYDKTVTGKIVDEAGETLPGVTIKIQGTQHGAMTDINGNFTIKVPSKSKIKLIISYIGYETMEIKVRPKDDGKVSLKLKMNAAVLGGLGVVYHNTNSPVA